MVKFCLKSYLLLLLLFYPIFSCVDPYPYGNTNSNPQSSWPEHGANTDPDPQDHNTGFYRRKQDVRDPRWSQPFPHSCKALAAPRPPGNGMFVASIVDDFSIFDIYWKGLFQLICQIFALQVFLEWNTFDKKGLYMFFTCSVLTFFSMYIRVRLARIGCFLLVSK